MRVEDIAFISQQYFGYFIAAVNCQLVHPAFHILQGLVRCEIEHNASSFGEFEEAINDSLISLLAGSVPQFQVEGLILNSHGLEFVIHSQSGILRGELSSKVAQ